MSLIDDFRTAMETGDQQAATAVLADDVELHSPAVITSEYVGRKLVGTVVGMAMATLQGVRVTDELHSHDGSTHALFFEAALGDQPAQGVFQLRTRDGRITHLTLLLRPLRALEAFVDAMRERGAQPALDHARGVR